MSDNRPDYFTLAMYKCYNHEHTVSIFSYKNDPLNIVSYVFYTEYKDVKWKVNFDTKNNVCEISYLALNNTPEKVTWHRKIIASFPINVGLTPENILKKLPTIITFS